MPTLKAVVLKHHKRQDDTYNVKIRVTHKRKSAYMHTSHYVKRHQVNARYEIIDPYIRADIDDQVTRLRRKISNNMRQVERMDASGVVALLSADDFQLRITDYIRRHAAKYAEGTRGIYLTVANSIDRYAPGLMVDDVTTGFLRDYETWMRKTMTTGGISLYMRTLRAAFNAARDEHNDEDNGIIRIANYPFRKYSIKEQSTAHRSLDIELVRKICNVVSVGRREQLASDVFRLSFGLAGMNTVDLYTCANLSGGRVEYRRTKTHTRSKQAGMMVIQVQPEVAPFFAKYKGVDRVFDFHTRYYNRLAFNKAVNKGLEQISTRLKVQKITTYHARHSWATIARNVCGFSKDDVGFCLGHAANTVTDRYIQPDFALVDRVNRAVLDVVF